jgi:hypothetical protein
LKQPSLPDFTGIVESAPVIRKDVGTMVSGHFVQCPRTPLGQYHGACPAYGLKVRFAGCPSGADDVSVPHETGVKGENHTFYNFQLVDNGMLIDSRSPSRQNQTSDKPLAVSNWPNRFKSFSKASRQGVVSHRVTVIRR